MLNEVKSPNAETAVDVAADLANLRSDVAKLSASVTEILRQQSTHTQDRVRGVVDATRERIAHSAADAKESVRSASAELESTIGRNPLTAVAIALMCGLVIGMMGRARR